MIELAGGIDNNNLEKVTNTSKLKLYLEYANDFWTMKNRVLEEVCTNSNLSLKYL